MFSRSSRDGRSPTTSDARCSLRRCVGFLLVAWFGLPGSPAVWTAVALSALAAPALTETAEGLLSMRIFRAPSRRLRSVLARARRSIALWVLHTVLLAHRSVVLSDAIARTLFRLAVSRLRLLQWTSAAATARAVGGDTLPRRFWREMMTAPLLAVAAAVPLVLLRPTALPAALPSCCSGSRPLRLRRA